MSAARLQRAATDDSGWHDELFGIIKTRSFRQGPYQLASGAWSNIYFNMKPTMMDPLGGMLVAQAMLDRLHAERADFVGGLALGAVPTLGAIAAIGQIERRPIGTFFVRQKAKDHGTKQLLEGLGPEVTLKGARVVLIDDVATKGGSVMQAIEAARDEGAIVDTALVIVDREEGAEDFLREKGIRLTSLFRAREFITL